MTMDQIFTFEYLYMYVRSIGYHQFGQTMDWPLMVLENLITEIYEDIIIYIVIKS